MHVFLHTPCGFLALSFAQVRRGVNSETFVVILRGKIGYTHFSATQSASNNTLGLVCCLDPLKRILQLLEGRRLRLASTLLPYLLDAQKASTRRPPPASTAASDAASTAASVETQPLAPQSPPPACLEKTGTEKVRRQTTKTSSVVLASHVLLQAY